MFNTAPRFKTIHFILPLIIFFSGIWGCKKNITYRDIVYTQNYESGTANNVTAITGYGENLTDIVKTYNGTKVLGMFNNTLVTTTVYGLPPHNMVYIAFDFYAHDAWQGIASTDVWNVRVNDGYQISTTFSNTPENKQSYPDWIGVGVPAPARGNSIDTLLPGYCLNKDLPNGTSKYRIAFTRPHVDSILLLQLNDAINGTNCTKSWSIDNLVIEAITN